MQGQLDLFGDEYALWDALWFQIESYDGLTRPSRYLRLQFLDALSDRRTFVLSAEMGVLFGEVRSTFCNGDFTATILLALSFIEHWLAFRVALRQGSKKATRAGISAILDFLRGNGELPVFLIERIDLLREIRNPFVHLRPGDYSRIDLLSTRMRESEVTVLEVEARRAVALLFAITDYMPDPWPLTDGLGKETPKAWLDDLGWEVPGTIAASHFGLFAPRMFREHISAGEAPEGDAYVSSRLGGQSGP